MKYADYLRKKRIEKGYTQEQVAEIVGVTREAISKWETKKARPSYEVLRELFSLYCFSYKEILEFFELSL